MHKLQRTIVPHMRMTADTSSADEKWGMILKLPYFTLRQFKRSEL